MISWVSLALLSAFFFGLKDFYSKKVLSTSKFSSEDILLVEYFLVFFLIFLFLRDSIDIFLFSSFWYLFLIKSFSLGISSLIYLKLLQKYEISHVSPLMNLSPLFLLILSILVLGEKLTLIQFIGIFSMIIVVYFFEIINHNHHKKNINLKHFHLFQKKNLNFYILVFLMLFSVSITAMSDKLIFNNGISVITNMFFSSLLIFFLVISYVFSNNKNNKKLNKTIFNPSLILISVFSIISTFLILYAISIPEALVSLVVPLKPKFDT